jgi:hypothetical protein
VTLTDRYVTPHDLGLDVAVVKLPDGNVIYPIDGNWDELRADWRLNEGACDPFWHKIQNRGDSGMRGLTAVEPRSHNNTPPAVIYSLRARASCARAYEWLSGNRGAEITVAFHYRQRIYREVRLNRLLREECLLGTPVTLQESLSFGVFVIPSERFELPGANIPAQLGPIGVAPTPQGREIAASSIEFALAGFLFDGRRTAERRFEEMKSIVRGDRPASEGPFR